MGCNKIGLEKQRINILLDGNRTGGIMQGLESVPTWFSDAMGITLASAQVILSVAVIFMVLLPVMYLSKGKSNIMLIFMFFLTESFLVGIGWLPFWLLVATVTLMALAVASLGRNVVTGG